MQHIHFFFNNCILIYNSNGKINNFQFNIMIHFLIIGTWPNDFGTWSLCDVNMLSENKRKAIKSGFREKIPFMRFIENNISERTYIVLI